MKKLFSFILSLTLFLTIIISAPINTFAANDDLQHISYEIIDSEAIITHIALFNYPKIPSKIKGFPVTAIDYETCYEMDSGDSVVIPEGVREIRNAAFYGCKKLSDITLPDSIESIESSAFWGTAYYNDKANWENGGLYIGKHLIAANNVDGTFTVKEGTLTIAEHAFLGRENITEIVLPKTLKNVCENAFTNCKKLKKISVSKDNKYLTSKNGVLFSKDGTELIAAPGAIKGSYSVPSGVKTIRKTAFQQCIYLEDIKLPSGIKNIGSYAFGWCDLLKSINIPDSVTQIGANILYNTKLQLDKSNWTDNILYVDNHLIASDYDNIKGEYTVKEGTKIIAGDAFGTCINLEKVTLPKSIISIGDSAFSNCEKLIEINLPDSITYIGESAFHGCKKLKSIKIPKKITVIREHTFWECSKLASITLPNNLKRIENSAFLMCNALKKINIPSSVNHIGASAFGSCNLKSITIPTNVKAIEQYTFSYSGLKEINISKSVTYIGTNAFAGCGSLVEITVPKSIKHIENSAFDECIKLKTVHFKGTKSDKAKISVGSNNYYFNTAVWKYEPQKAISSKNNTSSKKAIIENTFSIEETLSSEDTATESQDIENEITHTKNQVTQNNTWIIWLLVGSVAIGAGCGFIAFWFVVKKKN